MPAGVRRLGDQALATSGFRGSRSASVPGLPTRYGLAGGRSGARAAGRSGGRTCSSRRNARSFIGTPFTFMHAVVMEVARWATRRVLSVSM